MWMKVWRIPILTIFILANGFIFCDKGNPSDPGDRYPEAQAQNFDVEALIEAFDQISEVPGILSLLMGRNGVLAAEEYFNGSGPEVLHDVRSVTKSIVGLLIGIAIEEGLIQDVDQTVGDLLADILPPDLQQEKKDITIRNLLAMSCGLEWHELDGGNSYSEWYYSGDPVGWLLSQDFIHEPGDGFNYNTGSTHILSHMLTRATGMSTLDYAREKLFEPCGINSSDWTVVPDGINNGGAGAKVSPHALFTLGTLMLNHGEWDGVQVVPSAWVDSSTAVQNVTGDPIPYGPRYGYLWWLGTGLGHDYWMAMGWGGQFIICVPDLDLVVAATCIWQNVSSQDAERHWMDITSTIMEVVIPAVRE